jgi:hypothetical protein
MSGVDNIIQTTKTHTTEIEPMHKRHATRCTFHGGRQALLALSCAALLALCASCADRPARDEAAQKNTQPAPQASVDQAAPQPTQTASPATADASAAPSPTPPPAPPRAAEVADKLARVFQGVVRVDQARATGALVGDFNDDGSEDIAVVVKPDPAKLEEINSEVANWVLNDPQKVVLPDPNKAVQAPPRAAPVKVAPADLLLAVIHGYGTEGWRNPAAQQTYLLKNAVGTDLRAIAWQDAFGIPAASTPHRHGDVLREDLNSAQGFIYWTGAKYAWHAATKR